MVGLASSVASAGSEIRPWHATNLVGLERLRGGAAADEGPFGVRNGRGVLAALHTALISALIGAASARAADAPGAECCADLESRIAELEAGVARKGNRAVSLEVSGLVNQALMVWDDGGERNAYVVTNDNARTRLRFVGTAAIASGWKAGYRLELGVKASNSKLVNQRDDLDRRDHAIDIRDSIWFLQSERLGTLMIGSTFPSFTNIADANVTQTDWFAKYGGVENTGLSMFLRSGRTGELSRALTWRRIIGAGGDQPGETQRGFSQIKYVSPTWHGFTAASSLVADDFWDATLRYRGEVAGFDVAAGIGVVELLPGSRSRGVCALAQFVATGDTTKCREVSGSVSALHQGSGVFVNFGGGLTIEGLLGDTPRYAGTNVDDGELFLSGQVGVERKFNALGKSTFYAELYNYDGGAATGIPVRAGDPLNPTGMGTWTVWQSDMSVIGGGIAQGIDAASMIVYLSYRHVSGGVTLRQLQGVQATGPIAGTPIDDLDLLLTGAIINF